MQKHFAILVSVAMITMAGAIMAERSNLLGMITTGRSESQNVEDMRSSSLNMNYCVTGNLSNFACVTCCVNSPYVGQVSKNALITGCINACNSAFSSSSSSQYMPNSSWGNTFSSMTSCASARNCVAGNIGSCDPSTCLQAYNLGTCVANTQNCAFVTVRCADQSLCNNSRTSSSVSQSSASSSNSSSMTNPGF